MDAFLEGLYNVIIGPLALFSPEYAEKKAEMERWSRNRRHVDE